MEISKAEFNARHPKPQDIGVNDLYRFYGFNNYLEDLFVKSRFHFSYPYDFNDPFECRPYFDIKKLNASKVRKKLVKVFREQGFSKKQAEISVSQNMREPIEFQKMMREVTHGVLSRMKIACLTSDYKNTLMWSHYAKSHTGFCIRVSEEIMKILPIYKVDYTETYPHIHYPLYMDERGFQDALVKSEAWSYESEYRCALYADSEVFKAVSSDWYGDGFILPAGFITDVYLGVCITEQNKELIIEAIDNGPHTPNVWQAEMHERQFSLEFKIIK